MSKIVVIISFALLIAVSNATPSPSTVTATTSSFNITPVLVWSSTNTTDNVATKFLADSIPLQGTAFGADASSNGTAWAYGLTYTTGTSGSATLLIQRKLSATTLLTETDTTEGAVGTSADTQSTLTTISTYFAPVLATGPGYLAVVYASLTGSSPYTETLSISIWTAGTATATVSAKVISTLTVNGIAPGTTANAGSWYDFHIGSVWYEDGIFWVVYSIITGTVVTTPSTSTTYTESGVYIQGISASTGTLSFTTSTAAGVVATSSSVVVVSGLTAAISTTYAAGVSTSLYPTGGQTNYTGVVNSDAITVVYKVPGATSSTAGITYSAKVAKSTGTLTAPTSLITDTIAGTSTGGNTYTPAGTFFSNYTYGILLQNASQPTSSGTTKYYLAICPNNTGSLCTDSNITFSSAVAPSAGGLTIQGTGVPYNGTGFALLVWYVTSATATSTVYPYNVVANAYTASAINLTSTATTLISPFNGKANIFIDTNYALWYGYATYDTTQATTAYATSGYLGRIYYGLLTYTPYSSFGNVLVSIFAFLALMIASLFSF